MKRNPASDLDARPHEPPTDEAADNAHRQAAATDVMTLSSAPDGRSRSRPPTPSSRASSVRRVVVRRDVDDAQRQDGPVGMVERLAGLSNAQDDEGAVSPLPEPSAEPLSEGREPQSSSGEYRISTGQARLDRVYERLVALGLRRRARLHQIATQAEE